MFCLSLVEGDLCSCTFHTCDCFGIGDFDILKDVQSHIESQSPVCAPLSKSIVLLQWSQLSLRYRGPSANRFLTTQRQIGQISIYGTCVAVAPLIRSKQAFIYVMISVSPQQVPSCSFLSGVEGFVAISLPFICMYVCVCMHTCLRMQLSVDELGFVCLCFQMLSL